MGNFEEEQKKQLRLVILIGVAILLFIVMLIVIGYKKLDKSTVIDSGNLLKSPDVIENNDDDLSKDGNEITDGEKQEEIIKEKKNDKYSDPFYSQIYDQIQREKSLPFNDLAYNYYPGENYINNAADEDGSLHVFKKNPIMIYVPQGEYYDPITQAFVSYNNNFKGVLSFKATNNPNESDIKIVLTDDFSSSSDLGDAIGLGAPRKFDKDGNITYAELKILNQNNEGGYKPSMIAVYNTALHEIGHCIGILGHSSNKGDVMYKSLDTDKDFKVLKNFSYRDKETIKLMYSKRSDYIANAMKNAKQEKLKENLEYAQESNNSDSYLSVADSYYNMKQYDKALEAYKKALELNKNNYRIYIKLALCYEKAKKYDDEINLAKYAIKKANTNEQKAFANALIADGYLHKQEYEDAMFYMYSALAMDQKQKIYFIGYLEICNVLNKKAKAKEAYDAFSRNYDASSYTDEEKELIEWAKS